jgi:hypothetical protein
LLEAVTAKGIETRFGFGEVKMFYIFVDLEVTELIPL